MSSRSLKLVGNVRMSRPGRMASRRAFKSGDLAAVDIGPRETWDAVEIRFVDDVAVDQRQLHCPRSDEHFGEGGARSAATDDAEVERPELLNQASAQGFGGTVDEARHDSAPVDVVVEALASENQVVDAAERSPRGRQRQKRDGTRGPRERTFCSAGGGSGSSRRSRPAASHSAST